MEKMEPWKAIEDQDNLYHDLLSAVITNRDKNKLCFVMHVSCQMYQTLTVAETIFSVWGYFFFFKNTLEKKNGSLFYLNQINSMLIHKKSV